MITYKLAVFVFLMAAASDALFLPPCLMQPLLGGLGGLSSMLQDRWVRDVGGLSRPRRFLWSNEDACDWLCDDADSRRDLGSVCARCCGWTTTSTTTTTTTTPRSDSSDQSSSSSSSDSADKKPVPAANNPNQEAQVAVPQQTFNS